MKNATRHLKNLVLYRRLVQQVRPYWRHLGGIFLVSLLSPPLALLTPLPLKLVVDNIVSNHALPRFLGAWLPEGMQHSSGALLAFAVSLVVFVALVSQL